MSQQQQQPHNADCEEITAHGANYYTNVAFKKGNYVWLLFFLNAHAGLKTTKNRKRFLLLSGPCPLFALHFQHDNNNPIS